jgi:hypothetical protein
MKTREIIQYIFSGLIILATLVWFALLMFITVPDGNKTLIDTAAGIFLGSGWTQILNWWFGSSKGSSEKTEIMAQQKVDNDVKDVKIAQIEADETKK